jgi:hypothetical protein
VHHHLSKKLCGDIQSLIDTLRKISIICPVCKEPFPERDEFLVHVRQELRHGNLNLVNRIREVLILIRYEVTRLAEEIRILGPPEDDETNQ